MGGNEFDESKHYLGTLCKRNHNYNNTETSLRYIKSKACIKCIYILIEKYKKEAIYITKKCMHCGVNFKRNTRWAVKKESFCSRQCMGNNRRLPMKPIKIGNRNLFLGHICQFNHEYKTTGKSLRLKPLKNRSSGICIECHKRYKRKTAIKLTCNTCKKEFYRPKQTVRNTRHLKNTYCSLSCYYKSRKKKFTTVKCAHCGIDINRDPWKVVSSKTKVFVCSNKCKGLNIWNRRHDLKIENQKERNIRTMRESILGRRYFGNWKTEPKKIKEAIYAWIDCKIVLIELNKLSNKKEKEHAGTF